MTAARDGRRLSRSTSRPRDRSRRRQRLRRLKRFQNDAARLPGIEAVLGPASLLERTAVLRRLTRQIASGGRQLVRLESGLERLLAATGRLNRGLEQGAAGADELNAGLGQAAAGSGEIAQGTEAAVPQTQQLADGVSRTGAGADRLSAAARRASKGSRELDDAIDELARVIEQPGRRCRVPADRPGEQRPVGGPVGASEPGQRRACGGGRSRRGACACRRAAGARHPRATEGQHRRLRDRVRDEQGGRAGDHRAASNRLVIGLGRIATGSAAAGRGHCADRRRRRSTRRRRR